LYLPNEWYSPTYGSPDYYISYNSPRWGVPINITGNQEAKEGVAYIGFIIYTNYNDNIKRRREYIQSQLIQPLVKDSNYCLQLYVSLADSFRYASRNQLGVYFSQTEINFNTDFHLPFTPQIIVSPDEYITDKANWLKFNFEFTASGGEEYIVLGNFNDTTTIDTLFVGGGRKSELAYIGTYYYIDDVYLGHCDSIPQDSSIGLMEIKLASQINIYPNPTSEHLFINYEGNEQLQLQLYNIVGQAVEIKPQQTGKQLQLSLNHLNKGIYFLDISTALDVTGNRHRVIKKIIKQ
jgi:hypothetical protein